MRALLAVLILAPLLATSTASAQVPHAPSPQDLAECGDLTPAPSGTWEYDASGPVGFHLYTPANLTARPALLVFLHPSTCGWRAFASTMARAADATGVLLLLPEAPEVTTALPDTIARHDGMRNWQPWSETDQHRDAGVPKLIAERARDIMSERDVSVAFVGGWSMGAGEAVNIAATYPDVFSGLGVVSGFEYAIAKDPASFYLNMGKSGPDPSTQGRAAHEAAGAAARPLRLFLYHTDADSIVSPVHAAELAQQWNVTNALAGAPAPGPMRERSGNVSGEPYHVRCWAAAEWWSVGHLAHTDFPGPSDKAPDIPRAMISFLRDGADGCAAPPGEDGAVAGGAMKPRAMPAIDGALVAGILCGVAMLSRRR